MKEEMRRVKEI